MDTTKALNVFLAVARANSFSQAALDIGSTTSAVSRVIAQLEEHLEVRLFHRTTRRISLTDEGERLFELADAGVRLLNEALDKTVYAKQRVGGVLRVAAPHAFGPKLIVPLMVDFQRVHPDIIFEAILDDQFTDVVAQKIDVGFRAGTEPKHNLISRPLGFVELAICASPDYIVAHGLPTRFEDLEKHRCTAFRNANTGRKLPWEFQINDELVYKEIAAVATFNDVATEVSAVRAGIGIGQIPTFMVKNDLMSGRLVKVLPDLTSRSMRVFLYYAGRQKMPARVRQFIDYVMESELNPFKHTDDARGR
jgi:DNA-binding transcriptional LysR family regulator